jgi:hypothetical protein
MLGFKVLREFLKPRSCYVIEDIQSHYTGLLLRDILDISIVDLLHVKGRWDDLLGVWYNP